MPKPHLTYRVYSQRGDSDVEAFTSFEKACAAAVVGSRHTQTAYVIDIYTSGLDGAREFAGEAGVRQYRKHPDPEKVFERIEIRADSLGGGYSDGR